MSMELTTIWEFMKVFFAYSFTTLFLPYFVFHNYLHKRSLSQKFILCTILGNFYMINIVFVIFLLHIPGRITLYLFTIVPALLAWQKVNRPPVQKWISLLTVNFSRLLLGEAKFRTILGTFLPYIKRTLKTTIKTFFSHIKSHFFQWGILLGILGFDLWYYGYQTVTKYIYGTSDIIVHHTWINYMDKGVIFYHGIYPFGFHNVVYFIHQFYHIEILSILRVFGVVQMLFIYMMLYELLRMVCRSRYIPLVGLFIFSVPDLFNFQATMRYQWSLPQEYAMIFLYPCAYFLIQFFQRKKEELAKEKQLRKKKQLYAWLAQYKIRPSTRSLVFFVMSFSMTLAGHFYITIIAVFLCLAIAIAYFPLVLHYRYFCSIAVAGLLSIFAAVAPMGVAYIQGTPLEGSLLWALGVISPTESQDTDSNSQEEVSVPAQTDAPAKKTDSSSKEVKKDTRLSSPNGFVQKLQPVLKPFAKIGSYFKFKFLLFHNISSMSLLDAYNSTKFISIVLYGIYGLCGISLVMALFTRRFYFRNLLGLGIYMFFMILLFCAGSFGLPTVMDAARTRIFLAYATPLLLVGCGDIACGIIACPLRYHRATELLPTGLLAVLVYVTITSHYVKPLNIMYSLQAPGEMQCDYQIMKSYPEKSWTIVTTTNSAQLVEKKGWHMEVCTFLDKMQHYNANTKVTIPTKYVFVYIEKKPLAYGSYDSVSRPPANIGYISKEAAKKDATYKGNSVYSTQNRYILESKLFYWAKAFEEKYPKEFQVYYEDDSFVCYRIIQNEYNLYNFAVDYEYNR